MAKEGEITNIKEGQKDKSNVPSNNRRASRGKKRGWKHIIDKENYSSGPGDNIYVFG